LSRAGRKRNKKGHCSEEIFKEGAFAKTQRKAKQKFRPARPGGFSGAKAYIRYVEVLKKSCNAVGRTFCAAINLNRKKQVERRGLIKPRFADPLQLVS
jgi:hypothetical protein